MKRLFLSIAIITVVLFTFNEVFAAIKVLKVKGSVAYKSGKKWAPLKSGMNLNEGTKISTGVRSHAILKINNSRVKIRQLTMMRIYRNRLTGKSSRTNIGLKYGSLNARVKRIKKLKTVFKIHTPVATSSVRGTEQNVFFGARIGMVIQVLQGLIEAESKNGTRKYIYNGKVYQLKADKATIENILAQIKDGSLVKLFSENMTAEEKFFNSLFGDDTFDGGSALTDYFHSSAGKTTINLRLKYE